MTARAERMLIRSFDTHGQSIRVHWRGADAPQLFIATLMYDISYLLLFRQSSVS